MAPRGVNCMWSTARETADRLLRGEVNVSQVQWTLDGSRIAYVARRHDDKHSGLYVIPIDGGESTKLFEHDASVSGVSFCPTDGRIAFLAKPKKDARQEDYEDQGFDQEIYEEQLINRSVWITDLEKEAAAAPLDLEGSASFVAWSPNGKKLVVVLAPSPLIDDSYMFKRVHVVDAVTGRIIQSIKNPGKLGAVRWSPDGKRLALISAVDLHDPSEGHLFLADVPGDGEIRDLMPDYEGQVESIEWKDADAILWIGSEGQHTKLATTTIGGDVETLIPASAPILADLSLSDDSSRIAVLGHTSRHPAEVMIMQLGEDQPNRITDSNPWLAEMRFAKQEVFQWTARDGLELEGVLVYPLNAEEGTQYPMIMAVHGGPESHVSDGWVTRYSYPGAGRGGTRFRRVLSQLPGAALVVGSSSRNSAKVTRPARSSMTSSTALMHLPRKGWSIPDRVGITGGSYGGYASAWGATYYSDRYAASVMFVGISDNISKYGTTDIPQEMLLVHQRKQLWDDWQFFLDRSPIRYVERNQTPTLILHGKNDPRVHPSQSLELFRHLKTLDQAPVRLVLYEGEGHGNRKAAARFDLQPADAPLDGTLPSRTWRQCPGSSDRLRKGNAVGADYNDRKKLRIGWPGM